MHNTALIGMLVMTLRPWYPDMEVGGSFLYCINISCSYASHLFIIVLL